MAMPERAERVELTGSSVRTEDWPAQATDSIVKVVGSVHDKVTGPITTVARAIVFGTFAAILGATAFVMFVVLLVRVVDNYLPDSVFGHEHVWVVYLLLGGLFSLVAMFLWAKRKPRPATS